MVKTTSPTRVRTQKNAKNGTFFYKEHKRTQRTERSFEKNGCPTLLVTHTNPDNVKLKKMLQYRQSNKQQVTVSWPSNLVIQQQQLSPLHSSVKLFCFKSTHPTGGKPNCGKNCEFLITIYSYNQACWVINHLAYYNHSIGTILIIVYPFIHAFCLLLLFV